MPSPLGGRGKAFLDKIRGRRSATRRELAALQGRFADLERRVGAIEGIDLHRLESQILAPTEELKDQSNRRWKAARPETDLTWSRAVSGAPFVDALLRNVKPVSTTRLLEIGPGYGRILRAYLESKQPFATYLGCDISQENVEHLSKTFGSDRVRFLHADAESAPLGGPYDLAYSSLVFKHLFPSCEKLAQNVRASLARGGCLAFDVWEGPYRWFERRNQGQAFIHQYEKDELRELLARAGYGRVAFDTVVHDADHVRLLVVAFNDAAPA